MVIYKRYPLHKIPGIDVAKESHSKDPTKLTNCELLEIKERELKLLANKARLLKLPDKGKRIQDYYEKVVAELERRENVEEAAALFSQLNIAAKGKAMLNNLEWHGKLKLNGNGDPVDDVLDSDDESQLNPLRIIAERTMHERRTKVLPEEETLITAEDLDEIKTFEVDLSNSDTNTHENSNASSIVSKTELGNEKDTQAIDKFAHKLMVKSEQTSEPKEKYKPYKTTKSNVHDPDKERNRKLGNYWELSAAVPPPIKHKPVQLLSLKDSMELQSKYAKTLKELQKAYAEERLAMQLARMRKLQLPEEEILRKQESFTKYREQIKQINFEGKCRSKDEESEIYDDTSDVVSSGGINYTISD